MQQYPVRYRLRDYGLGLVGLQGFRVEVFGGFEAASVGMICVSDYRTNGPPLGFLHFVGPDDSSQSFGFAECRL